MPFKDSTPCPSDLNQLSLPGQGAPRPLPSPSKSYQSSTPTGQAACWSPFASGTEEQELPSHKDSPSEILVRLDRSRNELSLGNSLPGPPSQGSSSLEKEEAELHLYIISETSSIFLHLKSSWNNYIIVSALISCVCFSGGLWGGQAGSDVLSLPILEI